MQGWRFSSFPCEFTVLAPAEPTWIPEGDRRLLWARPGDCSCCARCGLLAREVTLASCVCYTTIDMENTLFSIPIRKKRDRKHLHLRRMDNNIKSPQSCLPASVILQFEEIWTIWTYHRAHTDPSQQHCVHGPGGQEWVARWRSWEDRCASEGAL